MVELESSLSIQEIKLFLLLAIDLYSYKMKLPKLKTGHGEIKPAVRMFFYTIVTHKSTEACCNQFYCKKRMICRSENYMGWNNLQTKIQLNCRRHGSL